MAKPNYLIFEVREGETRRRIKFRSWAFVLVFGLLLAVLALVDRGGIDQVRTGTTGATGLTGCQLEVAADELNVRAAPSADAVQVEVLTRGRRVDGTRTVTDGFRELTGGHWAAEEFLTPLPGTDCA